MSLANAITALRSHLETISEFTIKPTITRNEPRAQYPCVTMYVDNITSSLSSLQGEYSVSNFTLIIHIWTKLSGNESDGELLMYHYTDRIKRRLSSEVVNTSIPYVDNDDTIIYNLGSEFIDADFAINGDDNVTLRSTLRYNITYSYKLPTI
jgi:hypothetical protein